MYLYLEGKINNLFTLRFSLNKHFNVKKKITFDFTYENMEKKGYFSEKKNQYCTDSPFRGNPKTAKVQDVLGCLYYLGHIALPGHIRSGWSGDSVIWIPDGTEGIGKGQVSFSDS